MGRLAQSIIAGGLVAAAMGMVMKRSRSKMMINHYMSMMINMMAKLGMFRLIGTSRIFRNLVKAR